ncbi:TetR/AcrR family transcriptional regulator [Kineococcus rhizosphaerae]|uniref:TetR family transcriptional regulator n=1 Tax=Kineococcus rhizosphaerae TaxID=559628 RepID=A0A2T0R6A4_9ACTN|nr:TetR/AcrR family transcriptional regulator [Kineococcus rhizosphaerae]PRY16696.1 TetR family transcriptional regulator [Kineococcus rhizosphaerae]
MARWEPDARGRLLRTAVDLFAEQGYEATTTAQIAQRAGLTRTTLFRLFPDKREILFQGQDDLITVGVDAVHRTPADAPAIAAAAAAVAAIADAHVADRAGSRRITGLIAASPELRERAAFKRSSITEALQAALRERTGSHRLAGLLTDVAVRSYYDGFDVWISTDDDRSFSAVVLDELADGEAALRRLAGELTGPVPGRGARSRA